MSSNQLDSFNFDRSRLEAADQCERRYYWEYAFLGLGVRKLRTLPIWALLTGTFIHEGIELVLRGTSGQAAAASARQGYYEQIAPLLDSLDLGETKQLVEQEFDQQLDLVEALVYGWSLVGLPRYSATYELVEIEREEQISWLVNGHKLTLLTRADIISKLKGSPDVYMLHNLKSVSNADKKWQDQWQFDQQTLTERVATEARLEAEVLGVVIEGLCKGNRKEYPIGSGFWQHSSPLIWAWADKLDGQGLPGEQQAFYSRYEWTCNEPHKFSNGRKCMGGKQHRLSGVYKARVASSFNGGIVGWLDWLNLNDRELLEQQFISLMPIGRSPFEIERWKRQTLARELKRQQEAKVINEQFLAGNKGLAFELLDYSFPMTTGHGTCLRPYECQFKDLCWGSGDPFDDSIWGPREPNHPAELEAINGQT